jgi:hypothetical protein
MKQLLGNFSNLSSTTASVVHRHKHFISKSAPITLSQLSQLASSPISFCSIQSLLPVRSDQDEQNIYPTLLSRFRSRFVFSSAQISVDFYSGFGSSSPFLECLKLTLNEKSFMICCTKKWCERWWVGRLWLNKVQSWRPFLCIRIIHNSQILTFFSNTLNTISWPGKVHFDTSTKQIWFHLLSHLFRISNCYSPFSLLPV